MKVSFTKEWNKHQMVVFLFTICLHVTGAESFIQTENYFHQFEGDPSFNFTRVIVTFRWSQVECFLACNEDPSCIVVLTQETSNDTNKFNKMDNSLSEGSSPPEGLMCLKGKHAPAINCDLFIKFLSFIKHMVFKPQNWELHFAKATTLIWNICKFWSSSSV